SMALRIGLGVDYHQLAEGRKLMIGGIHIPYHKGAVGHSDADVLLHAICDALLGAACLGDIGSHFPDNSEKFKDIDSRILLKETMKLITHHKFHFVNLDSTLCLQEPKISPHIFEMRKCISEIIGTDVNSISIKATTTEKMGFVGRNEGLVAYATVLLESL
ncbi:MAG TPA: 2-C-methyl-D-erythritol 2,4-cyclodiphosphate synthase, partial [Flavisolibacter sp.]|nr:2-C-methyl-D-erythritol 2,4-cyclodiphosphate synthase [Flavisolibacter sp.]